MKQLHVEIRSVWAENLEHEFNIINSVVDRYPFVAIDIEFPGTIFTSDKPYYLRSPKENYELLKSNVENLHIIQFGLTLFDADGNIPDLGIWEFNFKDFDIVQDLCAIDSVKLLIRNGIDFKKNRIYGMDTARFAELLAKSRLLTSPNRNWVTFHGAYDFGYLLKAVSSGKLPTTLDGFLLSLKMKFGEKIFDVKQMMKSCNGLFGGLEKLAKTLKVERAAGQSHQAGSDSLLTGLIFPKMMKIYFPEDFGKTHAGLLYGLGVY